MNYKYLSDGRKVVVVGSLNNLETIVQEIFVAENGDEIPGGERFVTKSLHDQKVESWKEKEEKELGDRLEKIKKVISMEESKRCEASRKLKAMSDIVKSTSALVDNLTDEALETFVMFMTGNVKYLVFDSYHIKEPIEFINAVQDIDRCGSSVRYDGLKLLSVLGKSEGNIEYKINSCRDGSGSDTKCYPFSSLESAIEFIKKSAIERVANGRYTKDDHAVCEKLGIVFDAATKNAIIAILNKSTITSIENSKKTVSEYLERIAKLKSELITDLT